VDITENQVDNQLIGQMNSFQELQLLTRVALYEVPFFILGVLGCFFPWLYGFLPVHATEICLCSFYSKQQDPKTRYSPLFLHAEDFNALVIINQLSFYLCNLLFLLLLILMINRIRHINDNSMIKEECAVVCGWWVLCSTVQYTCFISLKANQC
jgi:Na+/H+ antiporter NhaB